MSYVEINEVSPEQSITEYGCRNIRQFDLSAYYNEHLIASLWQDKEGNWHWTKRLYGIDTVENIETDILDDTSLNGIISDFVEQVRDWLDDEEGYLHNLKNDLDENLSIVIN